MQARALSGTWLLRIDDLDPLREAADAADGIVRELERLALYWDEDVVYQSRRRPAYLEALRRLDSGGWSFPCACSRREAGAGPYPGTCRDGMAPGLRARSVRARVGDTVVGFRDGFQGLQMCGLQRHTGDFVVHRADGIVAYHLAVVVDDAAQGITEVVRGADLMAPTAAQIHLQRCLGLPTPCYAHLPVAVNASGRKLSKQTHARPISGIAPSTLALGVLRFLGQDPPDDLGHTSVDEAWAWGIARWDPAKVPRDA